MNKTLNHCFTFCVRKMFLPLLFLISFLFIATDIDAQSFPAFPDFGIFTPEEVALKEVPFDKDANAVIIHDLARSEYNEEHNLITEHRIKIKILNEKGIDRGDIRIRFHHKDDFEFLSGIDAVIRTYEPNGQFTTEHIERKSIYTTKINQYYSETKFALPNVKAGSIFEYTYFSNMKHYGGLEDWSFQADLPTLTSYYRLAIVPNTEFTYQVYKLPDIPITIVNKMDGLVTYQMQNIPGLHDEAYMDSRRDNLQHVRFQLSAINRSGFKEKYINSWDDAARQLLDEPALGGQLNKSLSGTDEFIKETKAIADVTERIKAVYKYVQQKISWNGYYSKYSSDGVKKAWEKGSGTTGEINMIFVNLLTDVGVTACTLMVNDRDEGKIDVSYPFIDQFSKLVSYVSLPGKALVIDAADRSTPMQLIPLVLLNTYGYKIDKKNKGLMMIEDDKLYDDNKININGALSEEGVLTGTIITQSSDYARLERKTHFKKVASAKFLENYYSEGYTDLKADSLEIVNLDNDSLPLVQNLKFTQTLNTSGDYTFLNYHLFTGLLKNPFTNDFRFSDINFGSPQRIVVTQMVQLPPNYKVDALPKNTGMRTADTSLSFTRFLKEENGVISMQVKFEVNRSFFERDEYGMLKDFYKKLFVMLNEQIVLKLKK